MSDAHSDHGTVLGDWQTAVVYDPRAQELSLLVPDRDGKEELPLLEAALLACGMRLMVDPDFAREMEEWLEQRSSLRS